MASLLSNLALRPSATSVNSSNWICQSCRRHQSSFRRTRKALRVKPDPSFLPSKTETQDHIIFNPPSSAPNVYHTPAKFLPKGDPRRKFHTAAIASEPPPPPPAEAEVAASPPEEQTTLQSIASSRRPRGLPPTLQPRHEKKYHLTQDQIEEIRHLRAEDPRQWTRVRLAEKFECSQFFVSLCCSAPEMKAEQEKLAEKSRGLWGRRKREAREDRVTRREMWGREG